MSGNRIDYREQMFVLQATLHARSPEVMPGISLQLCGLTVPTLIVPPAALAHPFAITFEEATMALESLERMFVEPDGSFVWVSSNQSGSQTAPEWQLDGNLFDRNGRLLMVDLKGACAEAEFDRLLSSFGWPDTPVMFQLSREAVFLDEAAFRSYADRMS
jgi:hypothetical protein